MSTRSKSFAILFRVFYNSFYVVILLCLIALLFITPGDGIRQALHNDQIYNVFVIAGCYALTVLIAFLLYTNRIYTTRTALAAIPKAFVPVEKGDVGSSVRKMIVEGLTRSAVIAWDAKPRLPIEKTEQESAPATHEVDEANTLDEKHGKRHWLHRKSKTTREVFEQSVEIPKHRQVWGIVSHNGWASPLSSDLPNLEYINVILELPHLIEAKAVSLAPAVVYDDTGRPAPDIRALGLLQRPATLDLRNYVAQLTELNVLAPTELAADFVTAYEYARFSFQALNEAEFRHLMHMFAELLRSITALDPEWLQEVATETESLQEDQAGSCVEENHQSGATTPESCRSRSIVSLHSNARSNSQGTIRTTTRTRGSWPSRIPSGRSDFTNTPMRINSRNGDQDIFEEDCLTPGSVVVRRRTSQISTRSVLRKGPVVRKSAASLRSDSSASVIRLNVERDRDEQPYILQF